ESPHAAQRRRTWRRRHALAGSRPRTQSRPFPIRSRPLPKTIVTFSNILRSKGCNGHLSAAAMSIRISFKRGIKQSQQAAQYFRSVVGGLVESMLDGMEEHRYHIAAVKGPSLELRIWSVNALDQEDLHALIELLMTLHAQTQDLRQDP